MERLVSKVPWWGPQDPVKVDSGPRTYFRSILHRITVSIAMMVTLLET